MTLTAQQIETLAARKGVRRIAVENFLSTLGSEGASRKTGAIFNLWYDALAYGWNAATQRAIKAGINLYFS